jgi:uncharacterized protein with FMN-binding domain
MAQGSPNKKAANGLVSASCAAVLAVYVAGYVRTESASHQFETQVAERRLAPTIAMPTRTPSRMVEIHPAAPKDPTAPVRHPKREAAGKAAPIPTAEPAPQAAHVPEAAVAQSVAAPAEIAPPPSQPATPPAADPTPAQILEPAVSVADHKVDAVPAAPPAPTWKDGTYTGWGFSRHGNIEATVAIEGGRIASAIISQCRTRYSCSVIDRLPPEVSQRQSPDVDFVSGATQSADAFYEAVVAALNKAK